ncbi:hypothetical protein CA265_24605 [Sphingobacteriaceae bacterium GW460-11-11-14-LB5]|nr:hypothetical protein CA265_24605 [Sphingobacteriaceae bacterium GW460-11-11-14-LB5]
MLQGNASTARLLRAGGYGAKTVFHFQGCMVHQPLCLNPTVAAASDPSIGATANGGAANRQELQAIHFLIIKSILVSTPSFR